MLFGSSNTAFSPYLRAGQQSSTASDTGGNLQTVALRSAIAGAPMTGSPFNASSAAAASMAALFEQTAGWILLSSVRWAHSVPSFLQLPPTDQLALLRNCWLELVAFTYVQVRYGKLVSSDQSWYNSNFVLANILSNSK